MDMDIVGFAGLAALMVALIAWLRADTNRRIDRLEDRMNERMDRLEAAQGELRERMARLEGMVDGLREAVVAAVRRDQR